MVQLNAAISAKLGSLAGGVLKDHYLFNNTDTENYLERRFAKADKYAHNVKFGVFSDPKLIEQYYQIREKSYREDLKIPNFDGSEDYLDKVSYKFVATAGNNCVGGLRLTVCQPGSPVMMPMENENFTIRDHFPQINFDTLTYCEPSRLGILPEFRDGNLWDELQSKATQFLIKEIGVEILFGRSSAVQTRRFRTQFRSMGFELVIRHDIKANYVKSYDHLKMQFWAVDITKSQKFRAVLAAQTAEKRGFEALNIEFA